MLRLALHLSPSGSYRAGAYQLARTQQRRSRSISTVRRGSVGA
jgi:hypothetical protein